NVSLQLCQSTCAGEGALYFGVYDGKFCSCGDSQTFLSSGDKSAGTCDVVCAGDADEVCGGTESYSLYAVTMDMDSGDDIPTCSDGIVGVESESGDVCCGYRCGTCGGDRCVGWGDCCEETIQAEEELCSVTNAAPCIFH
ncbi:unnamed protein product, partial [Hapterophycus canaliculatus]